MKVQVVKLNGGTNVHPFQNFQGNDCLGFMLTNLFPDWAKTIIFGANIISVYVLFNKK